MKVCPNCQVREFSLRETWRHISDDAFQCDNCGEKLSVSPFSDVIIGSLLTTLSVALVPVILLLLVSSRFGYAITLIILLAAGWMGNILFAKIKVVT